MRAMKWVIPIIVLIASMVHADESEDSVYMVLQQATELSDSDRTREAAVILEELLEKLNDQGGMDPTVFFVVGSELARLYENLGEWAEADKLLKRVVSLQKIAYGDNNQQVAEAEKQLADLNKAWVQAKSDGEEDVKNVASPAVPVSQLDAGSRLSDTPNNSGSSGTWEVEAIDWNPDHIEQLYRISLRGIAQVTAALEWINLKGRNMTREEVDAILGRDGGKAEALFNLLYSEVKNQNAAYKNFLAMMKVAHEPQKFENWQSFVEGAEGVDMVKQYSDVDEYVKDVRGRFIETLSYCGLKENSTTARILGAANSIVSKKEALEEFWNDEDNRAKIRDALKLIDVDLDHELKQDPNFLITLAQRHIAPRSGKTYQSTLAELRRSWELLRTHAADLSSALRALGVDYNSQIKTLIAQQKEPVPRGPDTGAVIEDSQRAIIFIHPYRSTFAINLDTMDALTTVRDISALVGAWERGYFSNPAIPVGAVRKLLSEARQPLLWQLKNRARERTQILNQFGAFMDRLDRELSAKYPGSDRMPDDPAVHWVEIGPDYVLPGLKNQDYPIELVIGGNARPWVTTGHEAAGQRFSMCRGSAVGCIFGICVKGDQTSREIAKTAFAHLQVDVGFNRALRFRIWRRKEGSVEPRFDGHRFVELIYDQPISSDTLPEEGWLVGPRFGIPEDETPDSRKRTDAVFIECFPLPGLIDPFNAESNQPLTAEIRASWLAAVNLQVNPAKTFGKSRSGTPLHFSSPLWQTRDIVPESARFILFRNMHRQNADEWHEVGNISAPDDLKFYETTGAVYFEHHDQLEFVDDGREYFILHTCDHEPQPKKLIENIKGLNDLKTTTEQSGPFIITKVERLDDTSSFDPDEMYSIATPGIKVYYTVRDKNKLLSWRYRMFSVNPSGREKEERHNIFVGYDRPDFNYDPAVDREHVYSISYRLRTKITGRWKLRIVLQAGQEKTVAEEEITVKSVPGSSK